MSESLCPIILSCRTVFYLPNECIIEYLKHKQIPFIVKRKQIFVENINIAIEKNILNIKGREAFKSSNQLYAFYLNRDDPILKEIIINYIHKLEFNVRIEYLTKGTKYRIAKNYDYGGEYIEKEDDIEWFIA